MRTISILFLLLSAECLLFIISSRAHVMAQRLSRGLFSSSTNKLLEFNFVHNIYKHSIGVVSFTQKDRYPKALRRPRCRILASLSLYLSTKTAGYLEFSAPRSSPPINFVGGGERRKRAATALNDWINIREDIYPQHMLQIYASVVCELCLTLFLSLLALSLSVSHISHRFHLPISRTESI